MNIRVLSYDPEGDELDLLIDSDVPVQAASIPVGGGIYIRRDLASGHIVGAFIRGYAQFLRAVREGELTPTREAAKLGLGEVVEEIIAWQRETDRLSQSLRCYLGDIEPTAELVDLLLAA